MYYPCPAITLLLHIYRKQKSDKKGEMALVSLGQEDSESSVAHPSNCLLYLYIT